MKILVLTTLAVSAVSGGVACASSSYHAEMPGVHRTEADINRVLRGARREGCETSEMWDSFLGVLIDCKEGRVTVGRPAGARHDAPGKPIEVGCSNGLGDKEDCEAKWKRIFAAGERPCDAGETGVGCGPLKCVVTGEAEAEEKSSCEKALE